MRTKLTESDINNIVKRILNENGKSLGSIKDEFRHVSMRLMRSMEEYETLNRKGDYKRMGDEVDQLRRLVRKLKDVTQEIESKI